MLQNYEKNYLGEYIMTKKLCFSVAELMFHPIAIISSVNAPKCKPILISNFSEAQLIEIEQYAKNYTEKPYVIEGKDGIYVVIPSIYPTTTSVFLFRMNMKPNVFLRFVRDRKELFAISHNIAAKSARMSKRLDAEMQEFIEFCDALEHIFMGFDRLRLSFDNNENMDGYYGQLMAISEFLAVPIEKISISEKQDCNLNQKSDFALFTAFATTIMMLARNEALDRKINVKLNFYGASVIATLSFKTERPLRLTHETLLWDFLATDKKMFYEYADREGYFCVIFEPTFKDWALLGFKQNRDDMLFEF